VQQVIAIEFRFESQPSFWLAIIHRAPWLALARPGWPGRQRVIIRLGLGFLDFGIGRPSQSQLTSQSAQSIAVVVVHAVVLILVFVLICSWCYRTFAYPGIVMLGTIAPIGIGSTILGNTNLSELVHKSFCHSTGLLTKWTCTPLKPHRTLSHGCVRIQLQ
jgi:hypothetical protein